MTKQFDRSYFDKWYRSRTHRIGTSADLERQVHLAVSAAEYMLARPLRTVLDVGAGEGRWQPVLQKVAPSARYVGVDPSPYAVARFGEARNIRQGTFDDLYHLFGDYTFDLVVCCSVLNYLPKREFISALYSLASHTGGVAFLEIFTSDDDVVGDTNDWYTESPATYRRWLRRAGFIPCGLHCYITETVLDNSAALELA